MFNSHPNISNISILTIYALNVKSWAQISPHENFRYWASLLDTKYQWYIFIIIIFNCLNINNAIANLDKNTLLILDFDHKLSHLLVFSQSRTFINSSGLAAARGWRHSFSIHIVGGGGLWNMIILTERRLSGDRSETNWSELRGFEAGRRPSSRRSLLFNQDQPGSWIFFSFNCAGVRAYFQFKPCFYDNLDIWLDISKDYVIFQIFTHFSLSQNTKVAAWGSCS